MKRLKNIIMVLVGISFMMTGLGCASYVPSIPTAKIPSDIPSDVRKQIERLYSSDPIERADGAYELGEMRVEATPAIPFLVGMLGDDTVIKWTEWEKRRTIAGKRKPEGRTYDIFKLIGPYFEVTFVAQLALVKIGKPAVEPLIAALKDEDSRIGASWALREMKDPHTVEPLIVALKDEDLVVREKAALALGEIKDPRAVEPLIVALKGEDWIVMKAVWALGEIKDPHAVEPLILILKDNKDWAVRKEAAQSLGKIIGQYFGEDPVQWLKWWDENKGKFQK